jgi:hypothetical protein
VKLNPISPHIQNQVKRIEDFNIRPKTTKLEINKEENLINIGLGNDHLDMTTKAQATRTKIDKWDYIT